MKMGNHYQEKQSAKKEEKVQPPVEVKKEVIKKGKEMKNNIDALLDKIDDVLEKNAEEFVKNYVQKGGE